VGITVINNNAVNRENGYSLFLTEPYITEYPFYFAMVDHFADPTLYRYLPSGPSNKLVVCVDTNPKHSLAVTSMKLCLNDNGILLDIDKDLEKWDAIDTGFYQGTQETFTNLFLLEQKQRKITIKDMVQLHANNKTVETIDVTGNYWVNINTPEILEQAKKSIIKDYPHLLLAHSFLILDDQPAGYLWENGEESFDA
jgi:CDP-L-myo-inositol myo-inositolphosphotransferase